MSTTVEVRWFAPGHPPENLERRFDALGAPGREARTDAYLHLPGAVEVGVKLRAAGERFELKFREAEFGETRLAGGPAARLERWKKWSLPVTPGAGPGPGLGFPEGSWLHVDKARRLMVYQLTRDGAVLPVEAWPDEGCSLELTALRAAGQEWWSLGFEAFGDRLVDALLAVTEEFFRVPVATEALEGSLSCAYPAWLQTEIAGSAASSS